MWQEDIREYYLDWRGWYLDSPKARRAWRWAIKPTIIIWGTKKILEWMGSC